MYKRTVYAHYLIYEQLWKNSISSSLHQLWLHCSWSFITLLTTWPPFSSPIRVTSWRKSYERKPPLLQKMHWIVCHYIVKFILRFWPLLTCSHSKGSQKFNPRIFETNPQARKLNIMWAFQFISSYYENAVQIIKLPKSWALIFLPQKTRTKYKTNKKRNSSAEDKKKIVDELTLSLKKLFRIFITVYCTSKQINHYMI